MGGCTLVAKRMVNTAAAQACVGSIGEAIVLNGATGGFIQRAAKDRLRHGAAGILPSQAPARATLNMRSDDADLDADHDEHEDDHSHDGGITAPPAGMDIAWVDDVPAGQIRGIQVKMQRLPGRGVLRGKILQSCVFAVNLMGEHATDNGTRAGERAYKFYAMSHICLCGRKRGTPRIGKPEQRKRAARIAAGGLQQMWERLVAECGVGHHASADIGAEGDRVRHGSEVDADLVHDPTLRPPRRLTPTEELLLAQMHVNDGDPGRALGVFGTSPVGNSLDPAVQKALLGLTAYAELPTAEVMADKPGVTPLQLKPSTVESVINKLPSGRACGTFLTCYELIRGTYEAGAKQGWLRFFVGFAAGALTDDLAALMRALRAILLDKDGAGVNWRPLGMGEAERRVGCACVATQQRDKWNTFYTTELPEVKEARLAAIAAAEAKVDRCKGAVVATAKRPGATAARQALADAVSDAEVAKAPPNFPVQLCYAKNGTEILGHTLEGFKELAPDDVFVANDTFNMYNESLRTPTFEALHEHDPECKPVYRMLYGTEADIYLDRADNGSMVRLSMDEVCSRAPRIGIADDAIDPSDPDESIARAFQHGDLPPIFSSIVKAGGAVLRSVVILFLVSTRGWHQGCALATNGACTCHTTACWQSCRPSRRTAATDALPLATTRTRTAVTTSCSHGALKKSPGAWP